MHCNTRFFVPIIAITPFEQVLAVPDLEFLARFQRQQGREKIGIGVRVNLTFQIENEISIHSDWQGGPLFLKQPEREWPISRNYSEVRIPTTIMKVVNTVNVSVKDNLASRIKIERFSDYNLRVTARILKLYRREPKATFKDARQEITSKDVETAEVFWIKETQRNMVRTDVCVLYYEMMAYM